MKGALYKVQGPHGRRNRALFLCLDKQRSGDGQTRARIALMVERPGVKAAFAEFDGFSSGLVRCKPELRGRKPFQVPRGGLWLYGSVVSTVGLGSISFV